MKTLHTPGPWTIEHPGHLSHNTPVIESASGRVAMVRREEDADVIAAAPDLLEALENLENDDNSIPEHAWKLVTAAIAKAKGNAA